MKKLPLCRHVAAIVAERGPSTLDDIAPMFPDIERRTIQKALSNAKTMKLIDTIPGKTTKGSWGLPMATYIVLEDSEFGRQSDVVRPHRGIIPNVSSVWQLGAI